MKYDDIHAWLHVDVLQFKFLCSCFGVFRKCMIFSMNGEALYRCSYHASAAEPQADVWLVGTGRPSCGWWALQCQVQLQLWVVVQDWTGGDEEPEIWLCCAEPHLQGGWTPTHTVTLEPGILGNWVGKCQVVAAKSFGGEALLIPPAFVHESWGPQLRFLLHVMKDPLRLNKHADWQEL